MARVGSDGSLSFEAMLETGQLDSAVSETVKRISGLSDAVVSMGGTVDDFFEVIAENIRERERNVESYKQRLAELDNLIAQSGAQKYLTDEHKNLTAALKEESTALDGATRVQKALLKERDAIADAINEEVAAIEKATQAQKALESTHATFSTRIRQVKNEMNSLAREGVDVTSEAYQRLEAELVQLMQVQEGVTKRAKVLAKDDALLQGLIEGVSGLAGGLSAAAGAVGMFSEESENLQNVMLRVQSAMAMAVGIQQVYNALKKDSALQVGVLTQMKEWWAGVVAKAAAAETAETAAVASNTAAQAADTAATAANATATTAQAAAATTATAANRGLAGSFVLLSTAIKSVPVWGWIVAGVSALGAAIGIMSSKAREAKKAIDEYNDAIVEGSYKAVGGINSMVERWKVLGSELQGKERFVKENKRAFEELGLSINTVSDAERILSDPKNVEAFVKAQIIKAKALYEQKKAFDEIAKAEALRTKVNQMPDSVDAGVTINPMYGLGSNTNKLIKAEKERSKKELEEMDSQAKKHFATYAQLEAEAQTIIDSLNKTGQASVGMIAAIEDELSKRKDKLRTLTSEADIAREVQQIKALEERLNKLLGRDKNQSKAKKKEEDPFIENLKKVKAEYDRFLKWVSSGDKTLVAAADKEFEELKKKGASYIEYLRIERDKLLWLGDSGHLPKAEADQLKKLQDAIAEESNRQGFDVWKKDIAQQTEGARTVLELLDLIERKEKEIADDSTEYGEEKKKLIAEVREAANKRFKEETQALMEDYASFTDQKLTLDAQYYDDIDLLKKRHDEATTDAEKAAIDRTIAYRKEKYKEDLNNLESYEADLAIRGAERALEYQLLEIASKSYLWESDRKKDELEKRKAFVEGAIKRLEGLTPTKETTEQIEEARLEIEKLNRELQNIPVEKLQEVFGALQGITSALGNMSGTIGEIFQTISTNLSSIEKAFEKNKKGDTKFSWGDAATVAGSAVSIINAITAASKRRKEAEREFYHNQIALAHQYALSLNEQLRLQSEMSGGGFVTDYAGRIEDGFAAMTDASVKYNEALNKLSEGKAKIDQKNAVDWGVVGSTAVSGAVIGATIGSAVPVIGTVIGAVVGGLVGLFAGKKKKDLFGGLLEVYPQLIDGQGELNRGMAEALLASNQLDEKTAQLVQNALDWAGAVEEAKAQVREVVVDLAGDLGNSLRDAMVEAFKAGEDASERMFDAASRSLERFVENLLYSTIFSSVFDEFSNRLVNSLSPEGDQDILDDYEWLMGEMQYRGEAYAKWLEAIQKRAEEKGFEMWMPETDQKSGNSLSGAIKGITEDTASIIAGQLNASRMSQADAANSLRQILFVLSGIEANTRGVEINTRYLKDIYEKMTKGDSLRASGLS